MSKFSYIEQANQPDFDVRMELFIEALMNQTESDDEPWSKKGRHLAMALAANNSVDVLIAICGWSPTSIAKKAMIIPDDDKMFYDEPACGELSVQWSDGTETVSVCMINPKTFEVTDFDRSVFNGPAGETIESCKIGFAPILDYVQLNCIPGSQRRAECNSVAFWYEDCAIPGGKPPTDASAPDVK